MNKVIMMGRLVADPEMRYGGASNTAIGRFRIAVDRRFKRDGQPEADFFNCVSFGRQGEFVERYLHKGTKVVIDGELQNDNYTNKDGQTVYNNIIVTNNIEFAESKRAAQEGGYYQPPKETGFGGGGAAPMSDPGDGFMNINEAVEDDGIPFGDI